MNAVVVIAYKDLGEPARNAALEYVQLTYLRLGFLTRMAAVAPGTEFTKARALNRAIETLPPRTVIVQSDPDSLLVEPTHYRAAIRQASISDGLVIPYSRYLYLGPDATEQIVKGFWEPEEVGPADCDEFGEAGVGNVTVFSRETWEGAGGYDERFGLWGGDDAAFAIAAGNLGAPMRRLPGDVLHLWHPRHPDSRVGSPGYLAQMEILEAYRDADAVGPEAVRELVKSR